MDEQSTFSGEIVVASRIVDYLSSGLYESPAAALKELVNNSFDADATRVDLYVKPDVDRIIVADDGNGMDQTEFVKHFSRISESYKREESDHTGFGRPKIGKIGIGFIAANEICDTMELISTKAGKPEQLRVSINFEVMRQDPALRRRNGDGVVKADYDGTSYRSETERQNHYTRIFLKTIRGEAKSILESVLLGAGPTDYSAGDKSLYGLNASSICRHLKAGNLTTWSEFDAYTRNMLEIALNVPVPYHAAWLPGYLREQVLDIEQHAASLNFSLFIDGSEQRKPIVFNPTGPALISRFEYSGRHVAAKGYFYAQHTTIKPRELQGLLIRIRNAAVGSYDHSFMGFSPSEGSLFQRWISAEIMADDGLEDAMNIDRRTLRVTHPAYVELQKAIHGHLADVMKRVRSEIYGSRAEARSYARAREVEAKLIDVVDRQIAPISRRAADEVRQEWVGASSDESRTRQLLRKYTIDQLYRLVVEVAGEVLSPHDLRVFLGNLTQRLQR